MHTYMQGAGGNGEAPAVSTGSGSEGGTAAAGSGAVEEGSFVDDGDDDPAAPQGSGEPSTATALTAALHQGVRHHPKLSDPNKHTY